MKRNKNILIKNIYYMLCYAYSDIQIESLEDMEYTSFDSIENLMAEILVEGISKQIKQGLAKEYMNQDENLYVMRGKLNINKTIKNHVVHDNRLSCNYDVLSVDTVLNRILKSTMIALLRNNCIKKTTQDKLKQLLVFFNEINEIDVFRIDWNRLSFHRHNHRYRLLIGICELLSKGMLQTEETGNYKMYTFDDRQALYHLYERFIYEYYRKEYKCLSVTSSQIPWAIENDVYDLLPIMQSDICLEKDNKSLIIDAKCYSKTLQSNFDKKSVHSNNMYQIFTYVKNKEVAMQNDDCIVSGMLLYARTNEEIQPDVTYRISGNLITVTTLDLNQEFDVIKNQLNAIVTTYFGI